MEKGRKEKKNPKRFLIIKEGTRAGETILVPTQSNHLAMEQIYGLSTCMRRKTYAQLTSLTKCYQFYILLNLEMRDDRNQGGFN